MVLLADVLEVQLDAPVDVPVDLPRVAKPRIEMRVIRTHPGLVDVQTALCDGEDVGVVRVSRVNVLERRVVLVSEDTSRLNAQAATDEPALDRAAIERVRRDDVEPPRRNFRSLVALVVQL